MTRSLEISLAAAARRKERRADREADAHRTRVLADLFARRQELRGVHAHADLVDELGRWSA